MARSKNIRNQKGSGLAEMAVASLILIFMALFTLDIGTAVMCFNVNDRACRDAARAAAQGSDKTEAENLARQIIKSYPQFGPLAKNITVTGVNYVDFNGNPPSGQSPYVAVTTKMDCHSIAPLSVFGVEAIKAQFPVTKTYTFPIVKLKVPSGVAGA
jgi:Flp pilus assembly protein TadG